MDTEAVCRGSMFLGSGCGKCRKCKQEISNTCEQGRMPVGVPVQVWAFDENREKWIDIIALSMTDKNIFIQRPNGLEKLVPNSPAIKWRYPINHEQQKRDDIMEAWRRMSIDFAHDTEKSMVHAGTFIDMLFNKGFVEVEK